MVKLLERTIVESSNLVSIGYAPDEQILQVEFKGGSIYNYRNVPEAVHAELMNPVEFEGSHGKYFIHKIKKNPEVYPFEKVQDAIAKKQKAVQYD